MRRNWLVSLLAVLAVVTAGAPASGQQSPAAARQRRRGVRSEEDGGGGRRRRLADRRPRVESRPPTGTTDGRIGWAVRGRRAEPGRVNDIGTAAATPEARRQVAADLIDVYDQIVVRAQAHGIRVHGATLTPFGGNTGYDAPAREATRQTVNTWIRTSGRFDAVLDFDRVARDPQVPSRLLPAYDVGDHLHLSPAGYRALADSVPASVFRR